MGPIFNDLDQRKLLLAALLVGAFAVVVLALPVVIPLAGFLVALGIIAAAVYGIWRFLSGQ